MTAYNHYRIQLKDAILGTAINASGGVCYVAQAGLPDKQTIYSDANGTSLSNPIALTAGYIDFYTLSTVASVDLYIMGPNGHFLSVAGVAPSGPNELVLPTNSNRHIAKIPFSINDTAANTETDTKFAFPTTAMWLDRLHGCGLRVTVADDSAGGKTMDVGTLSSQAGGDANGLIAGSSTAATGQVIGTNGALFSSNAPAAVDVNAAAKNISYTLSASATHVKGFILLPYVLNA